MEALFDLSVNIMLPMFSSTILGAIEDLQKEQTPEYSDGVYFIEIRKKVFEKEGFLFNSLIPVLIDPLFCSLFKTDAIYANSESTKYSIVKINEDYNTYSGGIQVKFPGYKVDQKFLIQNDTDKEVHLADLKAFLLSKEKNSYDENSQLYFGNQSRFLKDQQQFMHISYASYPRSGNTFLRKYLESISGLATGSDMVMKFTLNTCLQYSGFKGEGIVDNRCWINKTHFPFRIPYDKEYFTNAIICCVRNPLDVICSNFLLLATMTHNRTTNEKFWEYDEWAQYVQTEIRAIQKWHQYWVDVAENQEVPVLFVRFEDLIQQPQEHLIDVFKFILAEENLQGTNVERRINEVVKKGNGCVLYKLKQGGGQVNKHLDKFTEAQMQDVMSELEYLIHYFGYAKIQDNPVGFYDYKGTAQQKSVQAYMGFQRSNIKHEKWVTSSQDEILKHVQFGINHQKGGFSMIKVKNVIYLKDIPTKSTVKEI